MQYDPLNVVGRNPDLVFQSRVKNYSQDLLNDLLYKERSLIDAWDKEMSIFLTSDRPFFSRVEKNRENGTIRTLGHRGQTECLSFQKQIVEEIRTKGPIAARELKFGAAEKGRWGHRQISGVALDYLYAAGRLGIHSKNSAQKKYDLIENLLPEKIISAKDPFADDNEFFEWYVLRRIGSLGAHWLRNGGGWLGYFLTNIELRKKIFAALEEKKLISPFHVPEINETFYIRRKDLSVLNESEKYDNAVRILAPLDNMLWDRILMKKVFDFEYTWEVYVPKEKRKYGYYVLPVLYRNNLIARFEPVKFIPGEPLKISSWWWENDFIKKSEKNNKKVYSAALKEAVINGLKNFAEYLGADGIEINSLKIVFRK